MEKRNWKVPREFVDQFDVDDEIKAFLLNYRYILFDAQTWDFRHESNEELRDNVFLLTAMAMMKYAYTDDTESILEIFKFWHEKGFTDDVENVVFFLIYISDTRNISVDQLKKMLEESKIDGGEIMETLGQRLREEGKKIGYEEGEKKGEKKAKLETARELIKRGVDKDIIAGATGLPLEKIEELAAEVH